jgi:hypothetical protein
MTENKLLSCVSRAITSELAWVPVGGIVIVGCRTTAEGIPGSSRAVTVVCCPLIVVVMVVKNGGMMVSVVEVPVLELVVEGRPSVGSPFDPDCGVENLRPSKTPVLVKLAMGIVSEPTIRLMALQQQ